MGLVILHDALGLAPPLRVGIVPAQPLMTWRPELGQHGGHTAGINRKSEQLVRNNLLQAVQPKCLYLRCCCTALLPHCYPCLSCRPAGALVQVMGRPSWIPVPDFALTTLLGEGASVVLEGQRVVPTRAQDAGFKFKYPQVRDALKAVLRQP